MDDFKKQLMIAFAEYLRAANQHSQAKQVLDEAVQPLQDAVNKASIAEGDAWRAVEHLMRENGVAEEIIPGDTIDYKLAYSAGRESVSVENPDAVPDQFCKIERKPKMKEIGDHLKYLASHDQPWPNWASITKSQPKLNWKTVKKNVTGKAA